MFEVVYYKNNKPCPDKNLREHYLDCLGRHKSLVKWGLKERKPLIRLLAAAVWARGYVATGATANHC